MQSIDFSAYAKSIDLNSYLKITDANNKYLTKTDAASTYSSKNDSSNIRMAFGYSSYGCRFDKSIKQYFISGYCNYNGFNTFIGVYNNGLSGGRLISIDRDNNAYSNTVECGEYGISFEFNGPSISAADVYSVIIYPAKYGDVTIS